MPGRPQGLIPVARHKLLSSKATVPELAGDFLPAVGIVLDSVPEKRILRVCFICRRAACRAAYKGLISFTRS
jgi:hypothetical protein